MRFLIILMSLAIAVTCMAGTDYWSKNKTMNMPTGVATTSCSFYNRLDQTTDKTAVMNEFYKRWLKGWVSAFVMYSDWDVRDIDDSEYINFIKEYCARFPNNTIGMAAHTFTYRIKK